MRKISVVYIVSEINKSLSFEWIAQSLNKEKYSLKFFLIGKKNSSLARSLKELNVEYVEFPFQSKRDLSLIFIKIFFNLLFKRPQVIHTHLFYANIIGLTASRLLGIRKRIFTRHHAMVHYNEYPSGLKWDKYFNGIATHIIAISENTRNILTTLDKADPKKIHVIHHGFDFEYFSNKDWNKISSLKKKYSPDKASPVIGVISRYLKLKGIQYIIPAFKKLQVDFPNAHLILANTIGNYRSEIVSLLNTLPPDSYTEIEFEEDLASLYNLFDVYVHVPIDAMSESFGQTYIEALAVGIPSVFTLSGVAPEFIRHNENALVVPFQQSDAIAEAAKTLLSNNELRNKLIENGKQSLASFSLSKMIDKLEEVYE
ncbi:MAG TPA: glycosyltransferase family 4 protein [Cyclobacteriaceae bacterium]